MLIIWLVALQRATPRSGQRGPSIVDISYWSITSSFHIRSSLKDILEVMELGKLLTCTSGCVVNYWWLQPVLPPHVSSPHHCMLRRCGYRIFPVGEDGVGGVDPKGIHEGWRSPPVRAVIQIWQPLLVQISPPSYTLLPSSLRQSLSVTYGGDIWTSNG